MTTIQYVATLTTVHGNGKITLNVCGYGSTIDAARKDARNQVKASIAAELKIDLAAISRPTTE